MIYPQADFHITTHKYIVDKFKARADKAGIKYSKYVTEWLIQALENEKNIKGGV